MKKLLSIMLVVLLICVNITVVAESDAWTCPQCNREGNTGNFCPSCGEARPPQKIICANCGSEYDLDADYAFCPNCGTRLPDGTLEKATVQGFGGDITVSVSFDTTGAITYISVEAPDEVLGQGVMDKEFTEQFIGKKLPIVLGNDVDAISGATVSSYAVVTALNSLAVEAPDNTEAGKIEETESDDTSLPADADQNAGIALPDGIYKTASAEGFGGNVTVSVTFDETGTITYMSVDVSDETVGQLLMDKEFTEQFIGKKLPVAYGDGVDAISGATLTSNAVLTALNSLAVETSDNTEVEKTEGTEQDNTVLPADADQNVGFAVQFGNELGMPTPESSALDVEGKWKITDVTGEGSETQFAELLNMGADVYMIFENGTLKMSYSILGISDTQTIGTYEVRDGKIYTNGTSVDCDISGDTMTLKGSGITMTLKKQ